MSLALAASCGLALRQRMAATFCIEPISDRRSIDHEGAGMLDWLRWLLFDANFLSDERRYWIGFLVSLACFAIASYSAKQVKSNPRLFTALALFAGAWVAVASTYEAAQLHKSINAGELKTLDRLSDLSAFITVFAGAVLAREGKEEHWFLNSHQLQVAAMAVLFALVIPRQLPPDWVAPQHVELVLGCILSVVGFLALGLGAKAVAKPWQFAAVVVILLGYAALEVGRDVELMIVVPRQRMSDFFALSFAAAKMLLTVTFCYIVLRHHRFGANDA